MGFDSTVKHLPEGDDEPRIPPTKEPDPDVPEPDKEACHVAPLLKKTA